MIKLHPSEAEQFNTVEELHKALRLQGCSGCSLGGQPGLYGPVVFRGDPKSRRMMIGEAPGQKEDLKGIPFCGPAGKVGDRYLLEHGGLNTNKDFMLTNTVFCRPIAPSGSGKQNLIPGEKCRRACRPYLLRQIEIVQPKLIVLLGKVATASVLELPQNIRMSDYVGNIYCRQEKFRDTIFYVMYHPSFILRTERSPGVQEKAQLQEAIKHIKDLRRIINEL